MVDLVSFLRRPVEPVVHCLCMASRSFELLCNDCEEFIRAVLRGHIRTCSLRIVYYSDRVMRSSTEEWTKLPYFICTLIHKIESFFNQLVCEPVRLIRDSLYRIAYRVSNNPRIVCIDLPPSNSSYSFKKLPSFLIGRFLVVDAVNETLVVSSESHDVVLKRLHELCKC